LYRVAIFFKSKQDTIIFNKVFAQLKNQFAGTLILHQRKEGGVHEESV